MQHLTLKPILSDKEAGELAGTLLNESHIKYLIRSDTEARDESGKLLVLFRSKILPAEICRVAYPALKDAAAPSENRGSAAGAMLDGNEKGIRKQFTRPGAVISGTHGTRSYPVRDDGTRSNTNYAKKVYSGIVGFFDRNARFPFCRQTAYSLQHPERFQAAIPFIRAIAANVPDRRAAQLAMVEKTSTDFVIPGTVFTTVTVNRNWQTAVHQDKGDLKAGFGVMSVLQHGKYDGGFLVFPKYGVGVDMRERDICFADVHQWHGNTPIKGIPDAFERISCVFYYRENMQYCGTVEQEREFAKNKPRGSAVNKARVNKEGKA